MTKQSIKLSEDFRSGLKRTVASILLFAFTYIVIIVLATLLTALCIYGGIIFIIAIPRFITLILGVGLASLGILVLIFLLKFMFQSHKVDRSHLQEITEADEPELFQLIREIVIEVDTNFPKKIYWSYDVNASVFYDSSFWSMFLPIKKNLQIGLGLANSVSAGELKAILAHEFGHFSQRTMKVGSYVYNVNHVIFNMLYNNESYKKLIENWAGVHRDFVIFISIAVKISQGIQWLLKIMYKVVNINYMSLSREMEFHADEIAAHVTGHVLLKSSLLRLNLAQYAYSSVLNYYDGHPNTRSRNIYPEQAFVMELLAKENSIPFENGLPQVTLYDHNRFNNSKLHIKDQWASHPSIEERICRLERLNITKEQNSYRPATNILNNARKT